MRSGAAAARAEGAGGSGGSGRIGGPLPSPARQADPSSTKSIQVGAPANGEGTSKGRTVRILVIPARAGLPENQCVMTISVYG